MDRNGYRQVMYADSEGTSTDNISLHPLLVVVPVMHTTDGSSSVIDCVIEEAIGSSPTAWRGEPIALRVHHSDRSAASRTFDQWTRAALPLELAIALTVVP